MIFITDVDGKVHHIAAGAIACITEPPGAYQWGDCGALVRLCDGFVIEARETAAEILQMMPAPQEATR